MLIRLVLTILITVALNTVLGNPSAAQTPPSAVPPPDAISSLIASLRKTARARDSLVSLADNTSGTSRDFLEELIWQRHKELHAGLLALADEVKAERSRNKGGTAVQGVVGDMFREEWPRLLAEIRRREAILTALIDSGDVAPSGQQVAIEAKKTRESDRLLESYRSLVDVLLVLERVDVDVAKQRALLVKRLPTTAARQVTRLQLASRDRATVGARLSRDATNAELRYAFDAADDRLKRVSRGMETAIDVMDRLGLEDTDLRVALITTTGRITADVFRWKVLVGIVQTWWGHLLEFLAARALPWLFQGLLIALTFIGFRALSQVVRRVVRRAVEHSQFSGLMRSTIVRLSAHAVMLIGFLVILTQVGVQVAPLLAGLGIAGFVVGFAMQNTLANFAAGGMILGNQPFDVGDEIEIAGVLGTVKRMSLMCTTILTPDNQTLIVPNSTVWGGVIRNRTAQPVRRVDLTFGVGYGDDIAKAEHTLEEIVAGAEHVLKEPAPIIRLNQLADSSVNFVVRVWTTKERYWDVYWDITRAVKLRFDQAGISIPFPQRELHVHVDKPMVGVGS